jgi:hypothetical protein
MVSTMTMNNTDQLRADLEALYESIQNGWSKYGGYECVYGENSTGCLGEQMYYICGYRELDLAHRDQWLRFKVASRYLAMQDALGFTRGSREWPEEYQRCLAIGMEVITYNDDPRRTWDEVKERVKDAIGKL